ncbi:MAG TPA: hypothetical protein VN229_01345 [Terriglobales bacterium]|nr:hypothetical protein [Terriglobales bacterium]
MTGVIRFPIHFHEKGPSRTYVEQTEIGPRLASPADPYVSLMLREACPKTRHDIFNRGFEVDPYYPALWLAAAAVQTSPLGRIFYLRIGVQTSGMAWHQFEEANDLHWWDDIGTRPMLRALYDCAAALNLIGDKTQEAVECLEYLLEIDPEDHLGAQAALDAMNCSYGAGWLPSPRA